MGGPFYSDTIHNPEFVARMLHHLENVPSDRYGTKARMAGMLTVISEVAIIFILFLTQC